MFEDFPQLNQSDNFTSGNEDVELLTCEDVDLVLFHWYWFYTDLICSFMSIAGNFLVILVVVKNARLRTTLNFLLVNMSVSDILFPVFSLSGVTFVDLALGGELNKISGWFLCSFVSFALNVSAAVSVESLVVIAVHRCYAVMFPLRAKVGEKTRIFAIIFVIWVVGIGLFAPYLFYYDVNSEDGFPVCVFTMDEKVQEIYDIFISVLLRTSPFLAMIIIYPVIIITLKRQRIPGDLVSSQAMRKKQNLHLTKMCLIIVCLFFCCWGIYEVLYMTSLYIHIRHFCRLTSAMYVVYTFPSISAAINPVVYFVYCRNFREALRNLFRKKQHPNCSKQKQTNRETIELT